VADPDDPPRRLGRYEIEKLIGVGAMGRVYRAHDPAVGRPVAIKTVRPDHADRSRAQEYMQRFQREARAAGALSHPNIVSVFDVGEDFLVMELLDGVDLAHYLERHGPMERAQALELFSGVADAIDTAHANGVIHRDLKPSNIMLLSNGRPKLMDFGVARMESSAMTRTGEVLGSPSYMAPEQIAGLAIDGRADIFSLGVVIYEALTGQRPFQGDTITTVIYKVVNQPAVPLRHWRADLPESLDAVFARVLAKDPGERFDSARALVAALGGEAPASDASSSFARTAAAAASGPRTTPGAEAETAIVAEAAELPAASATTTLASGLEATRLEPPAAAQAPSAAPSRVTGRVWIGGTLGVIAIALGAVAAWRLIPVEPSVLSVATRPSGARVEIDGQPAGASPLAVGVGPGTHELRVVLEGFAATTLRLDVREGEQPAPLQLDLVPVVGHLTVASDPGGADVFVDGEKVGVTPLDSYPVAPGRLDVLVNLPGTGAWRKTVELAAGDTLALEASLRAPPASAPAAAGPDGVYEVGGDVTAPQRVSGTPVAYPETARRIGQEGVVTVQMIVTEEGVPTGLEVVESAGDILDRAVLDAVATWRYEPAQRRGDAVRVRWRVRQRFERAR